MAKKKVEKEVNRFKEHHDYLQKNNQAEAKRTIEAICDMLNISVTAYYRKLKAPNVLSKADKLAIANVYGLQVHFLFPEFEMA